MRPGNSASASNGEANAAGTPDAGNAGCIRSECQLREQEYQRTRVDLEAAQAEAAEQRDELQVLKLLQVDTEDRLADAMSRNEHLVDECVRYKQKCSGAEAALKTSQALVGRMRESMDACLAQFRYVWWL
ncbi:hypothetical protein L226DRAFT_374112 [Lentinus tigrinus ALCF2SS1-7]|uniref:uncharacterized protein n=1 Tax=Lentinus tigrinus ALCF2SS1-7 TaxID=1328758 RepID=UPI001165D132|nr:hypothetical protein L226DRAFT_374112 [Lentinus tigrinus ALCF2SS1-7]